MATNKDSNNETNNMPGRKPSFVQSISQSFKAAFGKKDGYYFEIEFLTDTPSYHIGEKKQILVSYAEIGRSSNSTVRYKGDGIESLVSGTHVSITRNGGEWTLEHLSKTNRTIINSGERVIRPEDSFKKYVLQDGDTIQLAKGGPVFRFTVPAENSIQNIRQKSRGTTFIRNIVNQALAPYKKTIRTLSCALASLIVLFVGYVVFDHIKDEKNKEEYQAKIDQFKQEYALGIDSLTHIIEEQNQHISEQHHVDTIIIPVANPSIEEMMRNQNLAADIFFIVGKAYVEMNGSEIEIPDAGWTATGFLLNDGRFVTARHCVEEWWYSFNPESEMTRSALLSLNGGNIKIKSKIAAFSSKSGRRMSFTSDDFTIDRSKDRIETIDVDENGAAIRWNFVFPIDDTWDQTMFSTDFAWVQTRKTGTLVADIPLSTHLQSQQQLLVMGFPQQHGVESADNIEPISYQMQVTQPGIANNGCIMHSSGTDNGNSGGPIFAVKDGKLVVVGIVSRKDSRSDYYNWAVPISKIGNR